MKREKENYTIQSVSHALDILESFTKAESELGVTELSKRLSLHKNNVFRLLATLESRGYIEQNKETENYRLGPKTLQIGCTFIEQRECRRQARPILEKLMAATGETAVVAVLRSNKVIYMDSVDTDKTVKNRAALMDELKKVAERGWALENEEADEDVRAVAVPVRDFSRNVIAAIGIIAPAGRLGDDKLEKGGIVSLLKESGKALSVKLGFGGMNEKKE